ncbi:MAG: Na/Pi cotransporter family protein [Bacteroides sp.]|nr:Na/Pi cotransporter family protein [Prevotella sp.]MCM1408086.1 Na/Pi cotransporter family protein [Treponema brennaborense]MCM1469062.1 Na/Pi cotransporter family protein [Bacteroides sp.]
MIIVEMIFQLIGSMAFLLFGMKLMSDGVQKSAGKSLHRVLGLMTSNRFFAVLTGMFVTMIVQSSGATTVMVVSFVNAGLMTLPQSVGVIFGANIGTTITAWIVTLFGFKFKIASIAMPIFGIGFFITFFKKLKRENIGETLMGFGLLFLGLDFLSKTIPSLTAENVSFLAVFNDKGAVSIICGVAISAVITMLLHSSSAFTAIILTMSFNGLLSWEFSAAMILGSNVGSTIDAVIASAGTKVNARRAALVHVLFNVTGTFIALCFLHPLLALVDFITPGDVYNNMPIHIAALHTIFNFFNTLIFLPFTNQLAALTERIIKPNASETPAVYKLDYPSIGMKESIEAYIIRAEKEIADMTNLAIAMFTTIQKTIDNRSGALILENIEKLSEQEEYADQMQEQLSNFLVHCTQFSISDKTRNNISMMLHIVDEIESMTDDCFSIALLLKRSVEKQMKFEQKDLDRLDPYMELVQQFLEFIKEHINKHLTEKQLTMAEFLEDQIDTFRKQLRKVARKRLENGADVRTELLYIDLIRHIEKIGDHAFGISESLAQTK